MLYLNFDRDKVEQYRNALSTMHLDELKLWVKEMTKDEVVLSVILLEEIGTSDSKQKVILILSEIEERSTLEYLAKYLSIPFFLEIISHRKEIEKTLSNKISPILVGLRHDIFNQMLLEIDPPSLLALQQEACTEPLQHQLTVFSHQEINRLEILTENLRELELQIEFINLENISNVLMDDFLKEIKKIAEEVTSELCKINQALSLAWNTHREDLIDSLSFQKECWSKYEKLVIGFPRNDYTLPKGLYAKLEEKLNTIFSGPNHGEGLRDEDPAIEALAKLSIWYLQDYWEIGLLPEVNDIQQLDLDPKKHSEGERSDFKAELFLKVRKNLESKGLKTVFDLKSNQIFSKEMLKNYLSP